MIGDGYPYKFVTYLNSVEYYYFLKTEDPVYELITDLLKQFKKKSSSQKNDAKIIFAGIIQPPDRNIKNIFTTKKDNNVKFDLRL